MSDSPSPITKDEESEFDPASIFGQAKHIHEQIEDSLRLRRAVPHWDDPFQIVVTYRPLQVDELEKIYKKADKSKNPSRSAKGLIIATDILIAACVNVVGVIEGKEYAFAPDPMGPPEGFTPEMGEMIGADDPQVARSVVRRLFFNDGDLLNASQAVTDFSGITGREADEDYAGE